MHRTTHALAGLAVLAAVSGGVFAQTFGGTIDPAQSSSMLILGASLETDGMLIGDFDAVDNPGGTQTRPGFFGGSGNNPIPVSADFGVDSSLASMVTGGVVIDADFGTLTIDLQGFSVDLLAGGSAGTDLSVTLLYETFRTVSPTFLYPGGIPITIPLGQPASLSRAILTQTGSGQGTLTPTADPDVFDFAFVLPAQADLTLAIGLPGAEPTPTDLDAVPLALPLTGTIARQSDGSLVVAIAAAADTEPVTVPLDLGDLPAFPLELPTLGGETAGVVLTLTPSVVTLESSLAITLVINADAPACPATASSAHSEAGSNPLSPGRMITRTPRKPTEIAVQRRQPTVSPRKTAAPKVTASGMA